MPRHNRHGSGTPRTCPTAPSSTGTCGADNALKARIAIFAVLAVVGGLGEAELKQSLDSANPAPSATAPAAPSLAVGDCIASPNETVMAPIPCTSAHTAQIYTLFASESVADPTSTENCDESLVVSASLPQNNSEQYDLTDVNGTMTGICLIVTSPITHSVVRGG